MDNNEALRVIRNYNLISSYETKRTQTPIKIYLRLTVQFYVIRF